MGDLINYRLLIIFAVFFCTALSVLSQEAKIPTQLTDEELRSRIEAIAENSEAELDYSELVEDLRYYLKHPLNLNYATADELEKLIFLNEIQIFHLLAYRENYGYFSTIYELQAVEGMDKATIQSILPFIIVSPLKPKPVLTPRSIIKYGHHTFLSRYQQILQKKKGYAPIPDSVWESQPNSHYLGGPEKLYARYNFNAMNKVRLGFTAEKDPGEPLGTALLPDSLKRLTDTKLKNAIDFLSFHAGVFDIGHLKALTLGDYQLRFGQGLTLWSGLAFGKSTGGVDTRKFQQGISPYTSSDENRFFRGVAATVAFDIFELTAFYSKNRWDATISDDDSLSGDESYISNLQASGLHRTVTELQKKDAIDAEVFGSNISLNYKRLKIGVTGVYSKFNPPLQLTGSLYNRFYYSGQENFNGGIDYGYLFGRLSFFGEVSRSRNGSWAQLHGMTANLHPRLYLSVLYRNYQKDHQNFFNNPFAESNSFNERGIYSGIRFDLASKWQLTAYMDHFEFPWLRYHVNTPSVGSDYFLRLDHQLNRQVSMYFRFKQKTIPQNVSSENEPTSAPGHYRKSTIRYNVSYQLNKNIVMKDRVEYTIFNEDKNYGSGFLVYHDINMSFLENNLNIYFRYALFDTDSYDERIYAYENDMLYAFSVPAYYYKGSKIYMMTRINLNEKISFWARYSIIWLENKDEFGSGLEFIDQNRKSELKAQLMIKL